MSSKSACGLTVKEREDFLRHHGFEQVRSAKGSHDVWEHAEIKRLCQQGQKLEAPAYLINGNQKLEALTRILEATTVNGILIFVRTKIETVELADKLEARGYACAALNGDMAGPSRRAA